MRVRLMGPRPPNIRFRTGHPLARVARGGWASFEGRSRSRIDLLRRAVLGKMPHLA